METMVNATWRIVCPLLLLCLSITNAAAFVVSEGGSNVPDLPTDPWDYPASFYGGAWGAPLDVVLGTNTVSGGFHCIGFFCWDQADAFILEVPAGLRVNTIDWTSGGVMRLDIFDSGTANTVASLVQPGTGFISLSMNAGVYDVVIRNGLEYPTRDGGPWNLWFNATVVPVPPAILFLGSGLIGLAAFRRKSRK
jgi:hypothetical protein